MARPAAPKQEGEKTTQAKGTLKNKKVSPLLQKFQKRGEERKKHKTTYGSECLFKLTSEKGNPIYMLKAMDTIYLPAPEDDKEFYNEYKDFYEKDSNGELLTGVLSIRYLRGNKSIFVDNQPKTPQKAEYITFEQGNLSVNNKKDFPKYKFLKLSNKNVDFKHRNSSMDGLFFEVEEEKEQRIHLELTKKRQEAVSYIMNVEEIDEIAAYCVIYGISLESGDLDFIKGSLVAKVEKNPEEFLRRKDDPKVEAEAEYRMAREFGIIERNGNTLKWNGGSTITIVPSGKNEYEFMTDFLMNSDEGVEVHNEIKRKLVE